MLVRRCKSKFGEKANSAKKQLRAEGRDKEIQEKGVAIEDARATGNDKVTGTVMAKADNRKAKNHCPYNHASSCSNGDQEGGPAINNLHLHTQNA